MGDEEAGEQLSSEEQLSQVKTEVENWAKGKGLDLTTPNTQDLGEWSTPVGEKLHAWGGKHKLVVTEGDLEDMMQVVVKIGGIGKEGVIYRKGPTNLYGTGMEPELGWYGESPFDHDEGLNKTDVFGSTQKVLEKLKAARK